MHDLFQPATIKQQRILYLVTFFAWLVVWFFYILHLSPPVFPLDDPYLVLHNAQVLHLGFDPNFVGASPLTGATSAVHLVLVYLLMFVLPPLWALEILCWLVILAYVMGLLRLAFVFSASSLQAILLLLAGVTISFIPFQFLNGLETGLGITVLLWLLILASTPQQGFKRVGYWLLCGLLPFIRPELIVVSGLLFLRQAWLYWQQQPTWNFLWRNISIDGIWILVGALPWIIWYWLATGVPYPETILAKEAFVAGTYLPFLGKWHLFIGSIFYFINTAGWFGFIGMLVLLLLTPIGRLGLVFLAVFGFTYYFFYPTGFACNVQRYIYLCIPWLFYGAISCCRYPDKLVRYGATLFLATTMVQGMWNFSDRWQTYLDIRHYCATEYPAAAKWCQAHLPANALLLIHDAGYISFTTSFHMIDMVGLKTPAVIPFHQRVTLPSMGAKRAVAIGMIIQYFHPQYFVVIADWDRQLGIISGLRKLDWKLQLLHSSATGYSIYRIDKYAHINAESRGQAAG